MGVPTTRTPPHQPGTRQRRVLADLPILGAAELVGGQHRPTEGIDSRPDTLARSQTQNRIRYARSFRAETTGDALRQPAIPASSFATGNLSSLI